jgi:hypothetical protein
MGVAGSRAGALRQKLGRLLLFFEHRRQPALQHGLGVNMIEVFD